MKEVSIKLSEERILRMFHREGTSDFAVIQQIWVQLCYDLRKFSQGNDIMMSYRNILDSGKIPLIVDGGANIGASALFFSESYKEAKVLAIEPEGGNFELLLLNVRNHENVECMNVALSSTDGTLDLVDPGLKEWGFRTVPEEADSGARKICKIPSLSMKSLMERYKDKYEPFIVKIDIEGGEHDLFSRETEWLDTFKLLIIELHDWMLPGQANSANFLKAVAGLNRDFVYSGENIFSIKNRT